MIIELLSALGPRWSKIVKALPSRSISSIRNRWQRIDKGKRMQEEGKVSKNRCQVCGEPKRGHVCFARLRAAAAAKQAQEAETLASVLPDVSEIEPTEVEETSEETMVVGPMETAPTNVYPYDGAFTGLTSLSAVTAAAAAPPLEPPSNRSSVATQVVPADMEDDTVDINDLMNNLEEEELPEAPVLHRMTSGERVCAELGFGELKNATTEPTTPSRELHDDEEEDRLMITPIRDASTHSTRSEIFAGMILPSRLPSLDR